MKYRVEAIVVGVPNCLTRAAASKMADLAFTHDYDTQLGAWFAMLTLPFVFGGSSPRMLDLQTGETIAWFEHDPISGYSLRWIYPLTSLPGFR